MTKQRPTYGPADVFRATRGYANDVLLRTWVRDGRFNTKLAEPRAGKAREFTREAVYEAVFLSLFAQAHVSLDAASRINKKCLQKILSGELRVIAWRLGEDEARLLTLAESAARSPDGSVSLRSVATSLGPAYVVIYGPQLIAQVDGTLSGDDPEEGAQLAE